ncbi:MAG: AAA family ATPase, partial [Nocardioidaceae bacterium]
MHIEHVVPPPWEFEPVAAAGAPQPMSDGAGQHGAAPAAQATADQAPPMWQPVQPDAESAPSADASWQQPAAPDAPRFDEPEAEGGQADASVPTRHEWDRWPGPASSPAAPFEESQPFAPPGGMASNHQPDQQAAQPWTASPQVPAGDWTWEQQPGGPGQAPAAQWQGGSPEVAASAGQSPWPQPEHQPAGHHYDLGQFQQQGQQYGPPAQQFQPGHGQSQQHAVPPQAYQQPSMQPPAPGEAPQQPLPLTSDSLSPQALLRPRKAPPTSGWRRAVFKVSGGLIDPGESSKETQRQQMIAQARTPVAGGHYRVAVLSLKGGVGKTTSTVGLGSMLASLRGDRVIAVDANPDRGTLSEKIRLETRSNVRDLLAAKGMITRYADVRQHTSQATSRLEVLASDPDPAVSEAFSEDDYRQIAEVLEH